MLTNSDCFIRDCQLVFIIMLVEHNIIVLWSPVHSPLQWWTATLSILCTVESSAGYGELVS